MTKKNELEQLRREQLTSVCVSNSQFIPKNLVRRDPVTGKTYVNITELNNAMRN